MFGEFFHVRDLVFLADYSDGGDVSGSQSCKLLLVWLFLHSFLHGLVFYFRSAYVWGERVCILCALRLLQLCAHSALYDHICRKDLFLWALFWPVVAISPSFLSILCSFRCNFCLAPIIRFPGRIEFQTPEFLQFLKYYPGQRVSEEIMGCSSLLPPRLSSYFGSCLLSVLSDRQPHLDEDLVAARLSKSSKALVCSSVNPYSFALPNLYFLETLVHCRWTALPCISWSGNIVHGKCTANPPQSNQSWKTLQLNNALMPLLSWFFWGGFWNLCYHLLQETGAWVALGSTYWNFCLTEKLMHSYCSLHACKVFLFLLVLSWGQVLFFLYVAYILFSLSLHVKIHLSGDHVPNLSLTWNLRVWEFMTALYMFFCACYDAQHQLVGSLEPQTRLQSKLKTGCRGACVSLTSWFVSLFIVTTALLWCVIHGMPCLLKIMPTMKVFLHD